MELIFWYRITVEEAASTRRVNKGTGNSDNKRPQVVVNKFRENQNVFVKPNIVSRNWPYTDTVRSLRKVFIFGDNVPRGIRIHELNSWVK